MGQAGSGDMKCLLKRSFSGHGRRSGGKNNCQVFEACFHVTATELMFNVPLGLVKTAQAGDALPASLHVRACVFVCKWHDVKAAAGLCEMDRDKQKRCSA